ncbi:MAG: DUF2505 domain-containing protein [Microlunatus sp.]|nr:DUF2505 domain-containing protein [Microlunatus sp.]
MNIDTRAEFAAPPDKVFAMLTDKAFREQVCVQSQARTYEVIVEGNTVKTSRDLPAPDQARPFTGETLTVVEDVVWAEAGGDGSRTAAVTLKVPGQPVSFNGRYRLAPGGPGSTLTFTGELKVNVPLLGRKLEEAAAPALMAEFSTQEKVAVDWLAG